MINKQFINERLLLINSFLKELHELASLDENTFISQKRNTAACESFLRRTLEVVFDIGRHILAKTGHIDMSTEYKSIAKGLAEVGVIDRELEKKLVQMAGYRNRLVHMYNLVSDSELYQIIQSDLKDIEKFISAIKNFIQKTLT